MIHAFDVNLAKMYGVHSAIIFQHIGYWVQKNMVSGENFYDGEYWTYNSKAAFTKIFPYLTARQIDYALQQLIDCGVIKTGNYNKSAYDRTLWYALTEKGKSILQFCEMEETKLCNGNDNFVEPIPDINTDINTDINKKISPLYSAEYKNTAINTGDIKEKSSRFFPPTLEEVQA